MEWNDANIARLKELWADKDNAARYIGEVLGFTKNAVIGKAHRLGLEERPRKSAPGTRKHTRRIDGQFRLKKFKTVVVKIRPVEIASLNLPFMELENNSCRYPTSGGSPFLFCGHPKEVGSYCLHHHMLTHERAAQPIRVLEAA